MLTVTGLSKSFGGLRAVNDASFEIPAGRVSALIGPNGAGKSTTFNLVTGVLRGDTGQILYRGQDIGGLSPQARVKLGIGRAFQDVRLFPALSALDNVAAADPDQVSKGLAGVFLRPLWAWNSRRGARERATASLESVGFDLSKVHVAAKDLSYGEQKLVSLARLFAMGAELILLDEPASGLGGTSLEQLKKIVRGWVDSGRTVLLVEHNMLLVREMCDYAVFMNNGTVEALGTPEELMKSEHLQRVYLGAGDSDDEES